MQNSVVVLFASHNGSPHRETPERFPADEGPVEGPGCDGEARVDTRGREDASLEVPVPQEELHASNLDAATASIPEPSPAAHCDSGPTAVAPYSRTELVASPVQGKAAPAVGRLKIEWGNQVDEAGKKPVVTKLKGTEWITIAPASTEAPDARGQPLSNVDTRRVGKLGMNLVMGVKCGCTSHISSHLISLSTTEMAVIKWGDKQPAGEKTHAAPGRLPSDAWKVSEAVAPVPKKPTEFRFSGGGSLLPEAVTRAATHASATSDAPGAAARAADGEAHDDAEEDAADASAHSEDARPIGKLGTCDGLETAPTSFPSAV